MLTVTVTGKLNIDALRDEAQSDVYSFSERSRLFGYVVRKGLINIEVNVAPDAEKSKDATYTLYKNQFNAYTATVATQVMEAIAQKMQYFKEITISLTYTEDKEPEKGEHFDPEDKGEDPGMFPHLDPTPEIPDFDDSGIAIEEPSDLSLGDDGLLSLGGDDSDLVGSQADLLISALDLPNGLEEFLNGIGINTIKDLIGKTAAELHVCDENVVIIQKALADKNFRLKGEDSPMPDDDVLLSLGGDDLSPLDLRGGDDEGDGSVVVLQPDGLPSPEDLEKAAMQNLLARPISDLYLSVRARRCMIRLAISTIGELVAKTEGDLLECKQFGVTSLNEVREKLAEKKLKLKGD